MPYRLLADGVLIAHLAFIVFAVFGGMLAWKWPRAAWLHLPAAAWAAGIEFGGWYCPLTDLENFLLAAAGEATYQTGFIERYLLPVIYPPGLTRRHQIILGAAVIAINLFCYRRMLTAKDRRSRPNADPSDSSTT